ncbi:hypothetical protein GA0116948_11012 [Chitinophaga costaii]|uniref:Uncharacterized protein n=1 Tax=Chitinophaga costaii TaxID=1335309 RepID=A0A1C4EUF3_9BACT|nr:hypothetical protein [Chitinophaga costaii]PUZ21640.1 hypothetical protein DCM91_16545 [Chitinophaga costaii]SCC47267.1 hypothetical protein GA0116948_11012 [Chitinophaga costaii]
MELDIFSKIPAVKARLIKFAKDLWQKDKIIVVVVGLFTVILLLSNYYGYRICNCATTEKWQPGSGPRNGNHGVNHFYHK